jgi:L-2-hydroxycarboxylate dehydrogenase (NAD+)
MTETFQVAEGEGRRVSADSLSTTTQRVCEAVGFPTDDAREIADALVAADLRGVDTHGVSNMLRKYLDWAKSGHVNPTPELVIVRDAPAALVIDSDAGLGIAVAPRIMDMLIERAATFGVAFATVRNGRHLGMLAHHSMRASAAGMIGVCGTAGGPRMLPTFGREPRLGTNPIAVAFPSGRRPGFVFDAAMSAVAHNRLSLALRVDRPLPPNLFADERGRPYEEPVRPEFDFGTRMLPLGSTRGLGSHKGYGLAAIVEVLSGVLSGSEILSRMGLGFATHFFMVLDVRSFCDLDEFKIRMDAFLDSLSSTKPADGHDRVYYAGEMEEAVKDERTASGIPLHDEVIGWFRRTCSELGVEDGLEILS